MSVSVEGCSKLLKTLKHLDRVECYVDAKKTMLMLSGSSRVMREDWISRT